MTVTFLLAVNFLSGLIVLKLRNYGHLPKLERVEKEYAILQHTAQVADPCGRECGFTVIAPLVCCTKVLIGHNNGRMREVGRAGGGAREPRTPDVRSPRFS